MAVGMKMMRTSVSVKFSSDYLRFSMWTLWILHELLIIRLNCEMWFSQLSDYLSHVSMINETVNQYNWILWLSFTGSCLLVNGN